MDSNFTVFLGTNTIHNNINAPNAQIVTQNQSGGNNTVINPQVGVPLPIIKHINIAGLNEVVKELATRPGPRAEKISLPSDKFKYDSLYKTTFTILYTCQVNLNEIIFRIKRKDVIYLKVTHGGSMMSREGNDSIGKIFLVSRPENGYYTFEVYTAAKFGDVTTEFDYLK